MKNKKSAKKEKKEKTKTNKLSDNFLFLSDLPPSISSAGPLWSLWDPCGLITLPLRGEAHNPKSIHSSFYSLFCFVLFLVFFLPGPSQACGKGENGGGGGTVWLSTLPPHNRYFPADPLTSH